MPVNEMNLQKWSAIAEILSSVAVLVTLVFFVLEIRQTNDAVSANTYQGMAGIISDFNQTFLESPELAEFVVRTASADYEPTASEAIRLRAMISSQYRIIDNIWFQYQVGTISKQKMESLIYPAVLNFRGRSRMRVEWEKGADKLLLDPELVEYLNKKIYEVQPD
jgi:hypothetical protein